MTPPSNRSPAHRVSALAPVRLLLTTLLAAATLGVTAGQAGAQSAVTIETTTNGADADAAPGPSLAPGSAVTWTYQITATGQTTLYDLVVSDGSGAVPDCDVTGDGVADGTRVHPGPVEPGQSFTCWASGTVQAGGSGTWTASGTVRASDFDGGGQFEDTDPSHHTPSVPFTAQPGVTIQALVNGADADGQPGPYVAEGSPVVWTYVVTNTGNVALASIVVSDDAGHTVDCGETANVVAGPLAPGGSITCTTTSAARPFEAGVQSSLGRVEAQAIDPSSGGSLTRLTASDPSTYTPVELPGALAFTGPTETLAGGGAALAMVGAGLWSAAAALERRRRRHPHPAS